MNKEYVVHLDSLIQASHSSTLPTYPIRQETFWITNQYILPIHLLEYDFKWWHRDQPEAKFSIVKKDINQVIEPTTSFEEVINLDLSLLNFNKSDIDGKIDFHLVLKFKIGNEYFKKEVIR